MHIGVLADGFVGWSGGVGFIENILAGLLAVPDQVTQITVFVAVNDRFGAYRFAARLRRAALEPKNLKSHLFGPQNASLLEYAIESFTNVTPDVVEYYGPRSRLLSLCEAKQVDVLLPSLMPLKASKVPWAGYLSDCQHRHYPQLFSAGEIEARDKIFTSMLRKADAVIVNAKSVVADLETFFPKTRAKVFSLPFSPILRGAHVSDVISRTPSVRDKFEVGDKYFIICNQFWIHKDHATAFQAFAQLAHDSIFCDFKLVCTGLTEDYRFPGYFGELNMLLKELRIQNRVVFTGHIDKLEQLALLNGAVALIQPTLFEGGPGGGATFDAVGLGVCCLLSDIPVNLEINDPLVSFFKTGQVESLAKEMKRSAIICGTRPGIGVLMEKSGEYARVLGNGLFEVASEVLKDAN